MKRLSLRQSVHGLLLSSICWTLIIGCGTVQKHLAQSPDSSDQYQKHETRRITLDELDRPGIDQDQEEASVTVKLADNPDRDSKSTSADSMDYAIARQEQSLEESADSSPEKDKQPSEIQRVQFQEDADVPEPTLLTAPPVDQEESGWEETPHPVIEDTNANQFPIDLSTAFKLAGANNLQIAFAEERVQEALAQADAADLLWVPDLRAGIVYNNHSGQIQATEGEVLNVNRNSLFVGGGAGVANSPLNGGSGGPARMFVDLSPVDVVFEPLAARQEVEARQAESTAAFNNTLLETARAYIDLLRAHAQLAIAREAVGNAEQLVQITKDYAETGQGLEADAKRSLAELKHRKQRLLMAEEQAAVSSAELSRILRLDSKTRLVPADPIPVRLQLIDGRADLKSLVAQAQSSRPELDGASADLRETWYRMRQEKLRPWVPHLYAGASAGGFGGDTGGNLDNFSGRTDVDIAAIWEVENFGLGNRARRREQESRHRQAHISIDQIRDLIDMEVTQAHQRIRFRDQQIETTREQVEVAANALELNLDGIRGGAVRPIELQQAISAYASARSQHVEAILQYNNAQFELLRAIGQPPNL